MAEKTFYVPGKIIYEHWSAEKHRAEIHKETDLGVFKGVVVTHPDDYDIESRFRGFGYAERKCDLAYHIRKAEQLRCEAQGVEKAWKNRMLETGMPDEILAEATRKAQKEAEAQALYVRKVKKALYRFFYSDSIQLRKDSKAFQEKIKQIQEKKNLTVDKK